MSESNVVSFSGYKKQKSSIRREYELHILLLNQKLETIEADIREKQEVMLQIKEQIKFYERWMHRLEETEKEVSTEDEHT